MHGAGNDFVLVDGVSEAVRLRPRDIRRLADRHRGVGCDQVLLAEPPGRPDADFRYRIFNADGGEVGQCGNGARCFARFVRHRGLTTKDELVVETGRGLTRLRIREHQQVEADMGTPVLEPSAIPFQRPAQADEYELLAAGERLSIGALSLGNPHAVLRVEDSEHCGIERLGPAMESHPDFPERTNAGFMQVLDRDRIRLRVYERGAGETLACGSGACAAVVFGRLRGWLAAEVTVQLPGGKLAVSWNGGNAPVRLTGPTAIAFEGSIRL